MALPRDLRERFSENVVSFLVLNQKEAIQVVALYLSVGMISSDIPMDDVSEKDIPPFTSDGIRAMLEFGAGNVRRFLQLCAAAFDEAFPTRKEITREVVKVVFRRNTQLYFTKRNGHGQNSRVPNSRGLAIPPRLRL